MGPAFRDGYKNGVLSGGSDKDHGWRGIPGALMRPRNVWNFLHSEIYRLRIPVVLGFEGWDRQKGRGDQETHKPPGSARLPRKSYGCAER